MAAAKELKTYLLSETLYWMITLPGEQASLTPGQLLLATKRLEYAGLPVDKSNQLVQALAQWQAVRQQWLSAWRRKAEKELEERFKRFELNLAEWQEMAGRQDATIYNLLRERALIEVLVQDLQADMHENILAGLKRDDEWLASLTTDAPFIWEPQIAEAFPETTFWFLYRAPRNRISTS